MFWKINEFAMYDHQSLGDWPGDAYYSVAAVQNANVKWLDGGGDTRSEAVSNAIAHGRSLWGMGCVGRGDGGNYNTNVHCKRGQYVDCTG